jgi:hypothetical protein
MNTKQQEILKQLAKIGDVIFIRTDGSRLIINDEGKVPLQTQADAVLYYIERLDNDMLKLILDTDYVNKEFDKKAFINNIANAFVKFSETGNTFLNRYEGKCTSGVCTNSNCTGFSFVGNKTHDFMDLIVKTENDKVIEIFECNQFENENNDLLKNHKVTIDSEAFPF